MGTEWFLELWELLPCSSCLDGTVFGIGHSGPLCRFVLKPAEDRVGCDKA